MKQKENLVSGCKNIEQKWSHKPSKPSLEVSALAPQQNTINRLSPTMLYKIDREPGRWIKEAIHIRKEGQRAINRDEGSYTNSVMRIRLFSWHNYYLLCQEPDEEVMFLFF